MLSTVTTALSGKLSSTAGIPAALVDLSTVTTALGSKVDLNHPEHRVARLAKSPHAFRLLERLGTEPKVHYLSTKDWVRKMADNYRPGENPPLGRRATV